MPTIMLIIIPALLGFYPLGGVRKNKTQFICMTGQNTVSDCRGYKIYVQLHIDRALRFAAKWMKH